jgi:hypothetical protein
MVFGRNEARVNFKAAFRHSKIVETSPELNASHFQDAQAPPLRAIVDRHLFQQHDAVHNRVELKIVTSRWGCAGRGYIRR